MSSIRQDDPGEEPDYRFTLANERTFLAWIRTALGLLAGGIALSQLVPRFAIAGARTVLAVLCVVLAALTAGYGHTRWRAVERAMRHGEPLPANHSMVIFTAVVLLVSVLTAVLVIVG